MAVFFSSLSVREAGVERIGCSAVTRVLDEQ